MKIVYVALTTVIAVLFSGCGPKLAPPLAVPSMPNTTEEIIKVPLNWTSDYDIKDNIAYLKTHKVLVGSSVVLNVPSDVFKEQSDNSANSKEYKTKDFFNVAEQQIERGLLNAGFRVLSRAKFEAKLRSLRDQDRCDINEYRCLRSRVAPEAGPLLDSIKAKYESGVITADEYIKQIKIFKDRLKIQVVGKRRSSEDQELTDISEVIRAAGSDGVKAEYILQINDFNTRKRLIAENRLGEIEGVRSFIRKYPEIEAEFDNGNSVVSCAITGAVLNAKLIHVASGEIVWIGENKLNELDSGVNNITIELGARKKVSNAQSVRDFVRRNNGMYARELRYGRDTRVPAWDFRTELIPARLVKGTCSHKWTPTNEQSLKLARKISKELIATIKTVEKPQSVVPVIVPKREPIAATAVAKTPNEVKSMVSDNKISKPVESVDVKVD